MRSKDPLITSKEYARVIRGTDKSLAKKFGEEPTKRFPQCMRNKKRSFRCRLCGKRRSYKLEFIKGLDRNCYEIQCQYSDHDLAKLAVARIKLAKLIHVRP